MDKKKIIEAQSPQRAQSGVKRPQISKMDADVSSIAKALMDRLGEVFSRPLVSAGAEIWAALDQFATPTITQAV